MASDGIASPDPLHRLSGVSAKVAAVVADAVAYWAPEAPPATVVLGSIGQLLVERCDEFDDAELSAILGVVEDVLTSGTTGEKDAVATGLLEAALSRRRPTPHAAGARDGVRWARVPRLLCSVERVLRRRDQPEPTRAFVACLTKRRLPAGYVAPPS
jgi:hypothetical protein